MNPGEVPGWTRGGWRAAAHARIQETKQSAALATSVGPQPLWQAQVKDQIDATVTLAEEAVARPKTLGGWWSGAAVETAWQAIHRASALLPLVHDPDRLRVDLLRARERAVELPARNQFRLGLATKDLSDRLTRGTATRGDRHLVAAAFTEIYDASDSKHQELRGWRNRLIKMAGFTLLALVVLVVAASLRPTALPMCLPKAVCPSGAVGKPGPYDVPTVALVGMLAGGVLAAVLALRSTRPGSSAYTISPALALLRIALAGLTATIGVLILQSGVVTSFAGLTSTNQIVVYAVVFGFAQEAVTHLIAGRANAVQEAAEPGAARSTAT